MFSCRLVALVTGKNGSATGTMDINLPFPPYVTLTLDGISTHDNGYIESVVYDVVSKRFLVDLEICKNSKKTREFLMKLYVGAWNWELDPANEPPPPPRPAPNYTKAIKTLLEGRRGSLDQLQGNDKDKDKDTPPATAPPDQPLDPEVN